MNSKLDNAEFSDPDRESAHLLSLWLERCGVKPSTILEELRTLVEDSNDIGVIGSKTFSQWVSDVVSARQISGPTPEIRGNRVVALVRWFVREHQHRLQEVVKPEELVRFVSLYDNIPVKNRLQLLRIYHELKLNMGVLTPDSLLEVGDWRQQFTDWPVFGFVVDELMCLKASNILDMELVGLKEEDVRSWDWWHRLTARVSQTTKFNSHSPFQSLRGRYADVYYRYQMTKFMAVAEERCRLGDRRCEVLLELLKSSSGFAEMWEECKLNPSVIPSQAVGVPIPFFRHDATLVWMLELSVPIPGTDHYSLIVWSPIDEDTIEYTAEIRRISSTPGRYSKTTFFIEDYARYFREEERFALGVS